jgi:predicted DNA-binding transcriptional regulator YafY
VGNPHPHPAGGRAGRAGACSRTLGALIRRQRLRIRYHGRRRDEERARRPPQRLTQYRNSWYLDAWCHQARGLRSFALERIREQALLDEAAKEVPLPDLSAHFDQSYGIFSGPAEHRAELRFSPEMSRWVAEEIWHPDQQGSFDDNGCWLLRVPFGSARELIMDILRYGAEVEVLAPAFLREAVAAEARKTAAVYQSA